MRRRSPGSRGREYRALDRNYLEFCNRTEYHRARLAELAGCRARMADLARLADLAERRIRFAERLARQASADSSAATAVE